MAYALAVVAACLAAALRWWLGLLVGPSLPPYITFYPLVMLAALLGGAGPGLLATAVAALAVTYLFLPPAGSLAVPNPADQLSLALFCGINLAVTFICAALRAARQRTLAEARRAQASEIRYRGIFEAARDGILLLDANTHKISEANPFITRLLGYSRDELLSKELWEVGFLKDAEASRAVFDELAREGRIRYEDLPIRTKTGGNRDVEFVSNVYEEGGWPVVQCNIRDITERKRTQLDLAALREQLAADLADMTRLHELTTRFLGQQAPQSQLQATLDTAIAITGANKGNVQLFDPSAEELPIIVHRGFDKQFVEYFSGIRPGQAACGTALQSRHCIVVEDITLSPIFAADPRVFQTMFAAGVRAVICTPLLAGTGRIVGLLSVHFARPHQPSERDLRLLDLLARQAADFIERTQAEKALQQSAQRFRALVTATSQAIYSMSPDWTQMHWLHARHLLAETTAPKPDWLQKYIHPDDQARVVAAIQQAIGSESVFQLEHRVLRANGTLGWVWSRAVPLMSDRGEIVEWFGAATDITDRIRAEQALRESETRLRLAVETAELGTYERDLVTNKINLNPACQAILGAREPFAPDLAPRALHPEDRERVLPVVARAFDPALREICGAEFRILRPDGTVRWVAGRGRVLFDDSVNPPRPAKFIGVLNDITERKGLETQLQELAANLDRLVHERTAKLKEMVAELEGFSYSLVHDMRAPLRAMLSYGGIIEMEAGSRLDPQHSDLLRKIKLAATRMDELVTDSLNYTKILRQELPLAPLNLGPLIRGLVETYPNLQPARADITVEFADLFVHSNPAALTQVFSNLLDNAVKFVAPGVHPRVRVWAQPVPAPANDPSPHPSKVMVWVEDNGIGMPKDAHEKIFNMFQRLHRSDDYPGTGIGLTLVRKSLERTGGHICLESEPGKGSRFCVELPLANRDHQGFAE